MELSDGQFENMEDRIDETVNHRRLPGEGEFDIPGYVEACRRGRLRTGRGASRCCRRSCAACRSSRSSSGHTKRPPRSSAPASHEDSGRLESNSDDPAELDDERLVWIFTQMLRIREFEERVKRTFEEHPGVIRGHTHLADGAEASIVGSLATLRDGDQLMATYRCHGYPIALGTDTKAMMAEIYGRRDGLCGGYGGSMHLVDPERGFLGTSGIVGQGIPQATGVGLRRPDPTSRARSSCASSATAPPSRARSTSRSTWPRCGSCPSST